MQESASFWTDIKNLEEQLAKAPDSYCFARLAEVYLKVGLIDDALHVARQGIAKHPHYLSGQRVFAQACHARGLSDEAQTALQRITLVMPEDVSAQKMLGRLLAESGDTDAAGRAFRTALEFAPDDVESRIELDSLQRVTEMPTSELFESEVEAGDAGEADDAGEEDEADDSLIIDDLEIFEEIEVLEEDEEEEQEDPEEEPVVESLPPAVSPIFDAPAEPQHDPLSTGTLAELYVSQGFIQKALEIYRAILVDNPSNEGIATRVIALEALEASSFVTDSESVEAEVGIREADADFAFADNDFFEDDESTLMQEPDGLPLPETIPEGRDFPVLLSSVSSAPPQGHADTAVAELEGWLENIGRMRSCR